MSEPFGVASAIAALIAWTLFIQIWMFAVRIPAMQKARITPAEGAHVKDGALQTLPSSVRRVADNFNHLHEQPTLFYAGALLALALGATGPEATLAAWAYVALRILHSLTQTIVNNVSLRFFLFNASSLALAALTALAVLRLA